METRKPYPTDVSDEEWAFVAPYLTLMTPDAPQRDYLLCEVSNSVRWLVRAGAPWRLIPHDFPPWHTVYDQTQRWLKVGAFEAIMHDLRELLRVAQDRSAQPSAVILDARTLQSTPESGGRAGYDGHKRKRGSKTHIAADTLGNLLTIVVTPRERAGTRPGGQAGRSGTGCEARWWTWPTWIKAIPARTPQRRRQSTASSWKWSSCQRPNEAPCCHANGS